MHTFSDSATWPSTVLTVRGTFSWPPGSALDPVQPAEAGGSAKVASGSTRTDARRGPLTAAATASASTVTVMATMAAASKPRRGATA